MRREEEPRWRRYLRFRGSDVDADIADELRFHLEMREREFAAGGMDPEAAREAALAAFGDYAQVREWLRRHEHARRARNERAELLGGLAQDVHFGFRKLRKQPGFTVVAVVILGLGIGATTAVFSAVDAILLRPLPFADDSRLVISDRIEVPVSFPTTGPRTYPDYRDLETLGSIFSGVAAYAPTGLNLTGAGEPVRVRAALVTPSFFPTLGVAPALGRTFVAEEGEEGAPLSAILSHAAARRYFGEISQAIGRTIELTGRPHEVVGVMPGGFGYPYDADVWLPLPIPMPLAYMEMFRQMLPSVVIARLGPGITVEQADDRVRSLYAASEGRSQAYATSPVPLVAPLRKELVGERGEVVLILFGATLLVLLVACANVANLLLSRAAARRPEIAMRAVLGARRWRIARQLGVESLILAVSGGVLGIGIAVLGLGPLRTLVPAHLVGAVPLTIDVRVLAFAMTVVVTTSFIFGLWPVLSSSRLPASDTVRRSSAGQSAGREVTLTRRGIVVAEMAIALMLLIGAGVMLRSFGALMSVDGGIQAERVASLELSLARASYGTPAERRQFVNGVLDRLHEDPRVETAAFVNELPMRGATGIHIGIGPEDLPPERLVSVPDYPGALDLAVTPGYFETLGIPIVAGDNFSEGSGALGSTEVIINQLLAETFWPGEDPIGKRLGWGGMRTLTVVGVVGNVKPASLDADFTPQMYRLLQASPPSNLGLVARSSVAPSLLTSVLREAVHAVDPDQAVFNVKTMEEVIAGPLSTRRTQTVLVAIFGLLAVVLAVVGVYGVIAYDVAQRSREMGIRMALGATPRRILTHVVGSGVKLTAIGIVIGVAGAWFLVRLLDSALYGVGPRDPVSFLTAAFVLLSTALLAVLIPARRAMKVQPATMIRADP